MVSGLIPDARLGCISLTSRPSRAWLSTEGINPTFHQQGFAEISMDWYFQLSHSMGAMLKECDFVQVLSTDRVGHAQDLDYGTTLLTAFIDFI